MDLDHFKAVNDTYGHPVGDRVLRELADRLRVLTRPEDEFARVGGEEFALILPECDPAAAISILERMRRAVADAPFAEVRGRVTISIGVAHLSDADGPNELYQQADEALYLAKDEGRDRVASWVRGLVAAPVTAAHEPGERQRTVEGILALARAVDARDPAMRRHSGRVADLAVRLATVLGWRIEECALLRDAGLVHDVGKIGVSDSILLKAGRLTAAGARAGEAARRPRRPDRARRPDLRPGGLGQEPPRALGRRPATPTGCGASRSRPAPGSWRSPTPSTT